MQCRAEDSEREVWSDAEGSSPVSDESKEQEVSTNVHVTGRRAVRRKPEKGGSVLMRRLYHKERVHNGSKTTRFSVLMEW